MDVRSWLEAYRRAWEEKDADAAAALFAEHATYRSNIFEAPTRDERAYAGTGRTSRGRRRTYAW